MFHIDVKQLTSQQKVTISISQEIDGPTMNVIKRYDFGAQKVTPAQIFVNVNFGTYANAEAAHQAAEWWRLAAETAETLDRIFLTRTDLRRSISARMACHLPSEQGNEGPQVVSRTVTIVFDEGEK